MFQIGDKVVYPIHGAGIIEAIDEKEILGEKQPYYVIKMPVGNIRVMIPVEKASTLGIRPIVDMLTMENILLSFHDDESEPSLSWNERYRMNTNKMGTGDIQEAAEVIRSLLYRSKEKKLNTNEQNMLDNTKKILISELALVKGITESQATDLLNQEING